MTHRQQYAPCPASAAQMCRFWSGHMDGLERHLSANRWALAAVPVVLIAYPIARIAIHAALHAAVSVIARTVLNLL